MADVKGVLQKLFPFISMAASLGGPLGTMAASAVGKAIGVDKVDPTPDGISAAIAGATPDQILALKKADQDFQVQMESMGVKLEEIDAADRQSARTMQMTTRSWIVPALAIIVVVSYLGLLAALMAGKFHASDSQALLLLLGGLNTAFAAVIMYFFGSSAGSDRKTELLAQAPSIPTK